MTQPLHCHKNELTGDRKTLLSKPDCIILDEFMGSPTDVIRILQQQYGPSSNLICISLSASVNILMAKFLRKT